MGEPRCGSDPQGRRGRRERLSLQGSEGGLTGAPRGGGSGSVLRLCPWLGAGRPPGPLLEGDPCIGRWVLYC